jgi:hypothetical protein
MALSTESTSGDHDALSSLRLDVRRPVRAGRAVLAILKHSVRDAGTDERWVPIRVTAGRSTALYHSGHLRPRRSRSAVDSIRGANQASLIALEILVCSTVTV